MERTLSIVSGVDKVIAPGAEEKLNWEIVCSLHVADSNRSELTPPIPDIRVW